MENTMSLRRAINNMCKQCIYDKADKGTWRQQVQNCTSPSCALYDYRPKSTIKTEQIDVKTEKTT